MSCLKPSNEALCTTCRLGGLIRCPGLGTPLPLVANERPTIIYRGHVDRYRVNWGGIDLNWPKL